MESLRCLVFSLGFAFSLSSAMPILPPGCKSVVSFGIHTCHVNMANMSSSIITTATECVAACCDANFTCNVAQWCDPKQNCPTPGCFGGNEHIQPICRDQAGWQNFLVRLLICILTSIVGAPLSHVVNQSPYCFCHYCQVNWSPATTTTPAHNFTVSKALGSNMVLQRAPKSANVWGWATPGTVVTVALDGAPKQVVNPNPNHNHNLLP